VVTVPAALAEEYIVKDGQPVAEIVISETPERAVKFAAKELQAYIKEISGASLPIVPTFVAADKGKPKILTAHYPPDEERLPVRIYVGESSHTEKLGLNDTGLEYGAYRMKSGKEWLALLGNDTDFVPVGIWARTISHWTQEVEKEWQEAIGDKAWNNPIGAKLGLDYNRELDLWSHDQKGSLNATYAFLRSLGVRWYMPGELGEIVPALKDIALPSIDKTAIPFCKIRKASYVRYGIAQNGEIRWSLRTGLNDPFGYGTYHGMREFTRPAKNRKNHPEWYALCNGKRATDGKTPEPCLSSEGLLKENVEYLRFIFDMYGVEAISVWPDDGFTRMCECEECKGKDSPARDARGRLSDYVWDYVNRVAKEIEKTHPDKMIIGGAYSAYWLPPEKIKKLNANVMVHVVNARRRYPKSTARKAYGYSPEERLNILKDWARLTDSKIITFMNYGGAANTPGIIAKDLRALRGYIIGEDMWVAHEKGGLARHAFNHLNYYLCSRLWWDPGMDTEQLLAEYYEKFYGPAAAEMKAFIDFYEIHQQEFGPVDTADVLKKGLELFDAAKAKADPASAYGKRIALFEKGLKDFRSRYKQISLGRDDVPEIRGRAPARSLENLKIDGNLNEEVWKSSTKHLVANQTGRKVAFPTKFRLCADSQNVYVGIVCTDKPGEALNSTTTRNDDPAIWEGDYVDLLIETQSNSYYQISINPAGAVADFDRGNEGHWGSKWQSEIDIVTKVDKEKGVWTIEARIPVIPSDQDPLHEIVGSYPRRTLPWFFNICRQRKRGDVVERSAFSPTEKDTFLDFMKFGKMTGK